MDELQHGSTFSKELDSAEEPHIYHFDIQAGQTVTVTFAAPPFEYALLSDDQVPKGKMGVDHGVPKGKMGVDHDVPKGKMGVDHDVPKSLSSTQPLTLTQTLTFVGGSESQKIYIAVCSVSDFILPSTGYTISMTVE